MALLQLRSAAYFVRLVLFGALLLHRRDRADPDGEVEWLEGSDSGNGWCLWELDVRRYAFVGGAVLRE